MSGILSDDGSEKIASALEQDVNGTPPSIQKCQEIVATLSLGNAPLTEQQKMLLNPVRNKLFLQLGLLKHTPMNARLELGDRRLVQHGDDYVVVDSDLVQHGDDYVVVDSDLVQHGDDYVVVDSDLVQHGDDYVVVDSDLAQHGDDYVVVDSDLVQHGDDYVMVDSDGEI